MSQKRYFRFEAEISLLVMWIIIFAVKKNLWSCVGETGYEALES